MGLSVFFIVRDRKTLLQTPIIEKLRRKIGSLQSLTKKEVCKVFKNPEIFDGLWDYLKAHTRNPTKYFEILYNIIDDFDLLIE